MTTRTRIAPSPTGEDLHIGNAYTALINYVVAKKYDGKFLVRIEDTDRTRLVDGSEERILGSLSWLGLTPDEGVGIGGPYEPYRQSDNLPFYRASATELVERGSAYYCFCTPERLAKMREDQLARKEIARYDGTCRHLDPEEARRRVDAGEAHVIRLKVPSTGTTEFTDIIRGVISFENALIDDQVLIKSDGFPTYHLGVVVDDHRMEISHIIRGEEWISSTPKHVLLYRAFGWELPVFAHMPLLRNPDKSKLSKRKHPVWVSWYRDEGYLPEAVLNYLALMAWSMPDGRELFSLQEMIDAFELASVQTTAPVFDREKLRWMNGQYIQKSPLSSLTNQLFHFTQGKYPIDMIEKTIPLVRERIKTLREYEPMAGFFFSPPEVYEKPLVPEIQEALVHALGDCEWNHDAMEAAVRELAVQMDQKPKDMFMQLRIAVTGNTVGPPLLESMELLGKEESLSRLQPIRT